MTGAGDLPNRCGTIVDNLTRPSSMSTAAERARRDEAVNRAYKLQAVEGSKVCPPQYVLPDPHQRTRRLQAAVKMGTLGLGVVTLTHYTWPPFR